MSFLRKKDQILAALGNIRAMERLHVDTYTEGKIKNITGKKIAESKQGQLWISFQNLNGFLFMNCTILSRKSLKTSRGSKLLLLTKEYEIELDSDEKIIEPDFSNVSNTWITKMSFVLSNKEKKIIEERSFEEIGYHFKKESLNFKMKK
ncbi:hypothetical protein [Nonlabens sp. SY33080]|uniref:hypothetical protein n=1 Tax=Nonlabens sp. SY33080 TaxID=2719911 RepID=UPI001428B7D4|nr:hypothetical protein [Nonlabens sp. SY33080]